MCEFLSYVCVFVQFGHLIAKISFVMGVTWLFGLEKFKILKDRMLPNTFLYLLKPQINNKTGTSFCFDFHSFSKRFVNLVPDILLDRSKVFRALCREYNSS